MSEGVWAAIVAGVFSVAVVIVSWRRDKREKDASSDKSTAETAGAFAEASERITATVLSLIAPLNQQIATLNERVRYLEPFPAKVVALEHQVQFLNAYVEMLKGQVLALGGHPVSPPDVRTQADSI